jgi:GT2 family glycosyltransferase
MASLLSSVQIAGLVGAKILNPDKSFQLSYVDFPNLWREFLVLSGLGRRVFGSWYPSHKPKQNHVPRPVDYVSGACLLLRQSAHNDVGGFDDTYFMYAEEVDLCYRMRQGGWQVWYQPEAEVLHMGGGSSRSIPTKREADLYQSRVIYFMKHHGRMSAALLAGMIVLLTTAKSIIHEILRRVSGGKCGREVVDPRTLSRKLQNVL